MATSPKIPIKLTSKNDQKLIKATVCGGFYEQYNQIRATKITLCRLKCALEWHVC